jgi:Ni/Fe-hydrogenase subunit HybB-like protein
VPSLSNPRAPIHTMIYTPSWVEWSLMAGCFAAFALLYMGFTKLCPIISIWELEPAGDEQEVPAASPALAGEVR